jgi:hypothetical protein
MQAAGTFIPASWQGVVTICRNGDDKYCFLVHVDGMFFTNSQKDASFLVEIKS